jgi:hypothetical protein
LGPSSYRSMAHAFVGALKQAKASRISRALRKRLFDLFCADMDQ